VTLFATWALSASDDLAGTTSAAGKVVGDAVIWLDAPNAPRAAPAPPAVLEQRQLQFFPHVLAVQVGTKVKFPNNDRVFHNVFSYHDGKPFDLGLYPVGTVRDVPFSQPGLSRIFCNIHPQMAAYVMVVDTPYFGVSDEGGRFAIHGVPQGTYPYHAWRPGGSMLNATVDVRAGALLEVRWP
jgi:plastocyanin